MPRELLLPRRYSIPYQPRTQPSYKASSLDDETLANFGGVSLGKTAIKKDSLYAWFSIFHQRKMRFRETNYYEPSIGFLRN